MEKKNAKTEKKFTDEQKAVIETSLKSKSLVVNALAGSGKTSTAIACIEANAKKAKRMAYLCFNRSNKLEMEKKVKGKAKVDVTTLHALAFRHVGRKLNRELVTLKPHDIEKTCEFFHDNAHGGKKVTDNRINARCRKLLLDNLSDWCHSKEIEWRDFARLPRPLEMDWQLKRCGVDIEQFNDQTWKFWNLLLEDENRPITHDIYLKIYQLELAKNPKSTGYDLVIVDEAQDLFPVTESMVSCMRGSARVLFFGDRYQQIYAWNKSVNAMQFFEKGSDILALTQSFRCPANVTREAQKYLELLGFKGIIRPCSSPCQLDFHGPLLLSRSNSGLFSTLFQLLKVAPMEKIHLMGGAESYNFTPIEDYLHFLSGQKSKVKSPVIQMMNTPEEYDEYAENTEDREMKHAKVLVSCFGPAKTWDLLSAMKSGKLADDRRNADYILSTGHKSKGSEFETVVIGSTYSNIMDEYKNRLTPKEGVKKQQKEKFERACTNIRVPEGKKPFFIQAEELRLNYVSLTRSTDGLDAGNLLLDDADVAEIKKLIQEDEIILTDMDERGNVVRADGRK